MNTALNAVTIGLVAFGAIKVVRPVHEHLTLLGLFRTPNSTIHAQGDLVAIEDTIQCEDIHWYEQSNEIFTACQDEYSGRFSWFPPLGHFADYKKAGKGSLHVIDPQTFKSRRLAVKNMPSPFDTHGIDVIPSPDDPKSVYIFAVNHPPALCWSSPQGCESGAPKENATIEIFKHTLGSSSANHIQSVRHPLIRTPNDLVAHSPTQFWVTNDHKYIEGGMRMLEDVVPAAKWSDTVFVSVSSDGKVDAHVALTGLHNNNGLGRGPNGTLALVSAASGQLHIAVADPTPDRTLHVAEHVYFSSGLDNPFYFTDPLALDGDDASGFVLAGLSSIYSLAGHIPETDAKDPIYVWHARKVGREWRRKLIFEDDGTRIRSASAALCVPGKGFGESGMKEAWCFVTGFWSKNMLAFKADLGW